MFKNYLASKDLFYGKLKEEALDNDYYRRVIYTTVESQLVVMSLKPKEEIGKEKHSTSTQIITVVEGVGVAKVKNESWALSPGITIVIPSGIEHNIINASPDALLKLYTIYSPPVHSSKLKMKDK